MTMKLTKLERAHVNEVAVSAFNDARCTGLEHAINAAQCAASQESARLLMYKLNEREIS